jgi:hypothetical protein
MCCKCCRFLSTEISEGNQNLLHRRSKNCSNSWQKNVIVASVDSDPFFRSLTFSPDSQKLLTGSDDGHMKIYDVWVADHHGNVVQLPIVRSKLTRGFKVKEQTCFLEMEKWNQTRKSWYICICHSCFWLPWLLIGKIFLEHPLSGQSYLCIHRDRRSGHKWLRV